MYRTWKSSWLKQWHEHTVDKLSQNQGLDILDQSIVVDMKQKLLLVSRSQL